MTRGRVFLGAFKLFKPIDQMDDAELDARSESVVQGIAKRVRQRLDGSTAPVLRPTTKAGSVVNNPSPGAIGELVSGLGPVDRFVVVEWLNEAADGECYAQALREREDRWIVEHRDGGPTQHYQAIVTDKGIVAEILAGWAYQVPGWRESASWKRIDLPRQKGRQ
jgi:hypothetical protein